MNLIVRSFVSLATIAVVVSCLPGDHAFTASGTSSTQASRPDGSVSPQDPGYLKSINDHHNRKAMRAHGWKLLLQMTAGRDTPEWEHWDTKCTLKLSRFCDDTATKTRSPLPGSSPQTGDQTNDPNPRFSTIFYNDAAAATIRKYNLQSGAGLEKILFSGAPSPVSVPQFPPSAIVVKEIWEAVSVSTDGSDSAEISSIKVYDSSVLNHAQDGSLPQVGQWDPPAKILTDATGSPDKTQACKLNGNYDLAHDSVPISCFYFKDFTGGSHHYPCFESVLTNPSQLVPGTNNGATLPCLPVLVGLQIATREIENWTWTTFWWTNDAQGNPMHDDQPAGLDPRFRHFAMDTTFGPTSAEIAANPGNPHLPSVFNPYLEGPRPNGIHSNCYTCHKAAAYIPACDVNAASPPCLEQHTGQHVNGTPPPPEPCNLKPGENRIAANCPLMTSFLWSIPDNQDPKSGVLFVFKLRRPLPFFPPRPTRH